MSIIHVTPTDPRVGQMREDGSTARWPSQFLNGVAFNRLTDRYSRANIGAGYFVVIQTAHQPQQVLLVLPEAEAPPPIPKRRKRGIGQVRAASPDEDDSTEQNEENND